VGVAALREDKTRYEFMRLSSNVMETSKDWPGDDRSGGAERTRSWRNADPDFGGGESRL